MRTRTLLQELREAREAGEELGERAAGARHDRGDLERGQEAVAGGREAEVHDVPGLLAAQEHALAAHVSRPPARSPTSQRTTPMPSRRERAFEPQVAHRGGHDRRRLEEAGPRGRATGPEVEDGVAVAHRAALVGHDAAVGVAVEGDAEVGRRARAPPARPWPPGRVEPQSRVDVPAVGRGPEQLDLGAQACGRAAAGERSPRRCRRRGRRAGR